MTLTEAKAHLRVTHNLEDALIQGYLDAALTHVANYLGDDLPDPMPAPVEAAVLLLMADLYINRERQADKPLSENSAYALLLNPYRNMEVLP
ncbi:Phage gp6-like head-tail connector protein [compost metagenome]